MACDNLINANRFAQTLLFLAIFCKIVITGFNTDVEYEGVTYHVQTEDKGVETPLILSLVYNRGTILASKRSPYEDLLKGVFDENVLAERLQKQHKLICAAIRGGRLEDLKRMTMKDSAARKTESAAQKRLVNSNVALIEHEKVDNPQFFADKVSQTEIPAPAALSDLSEQTGQKPADKTDKVKTGVSETENSNQNPSAESPVRQHPPIPKPPPLISFQTVPKTFEGEPLVEAVEIFEEEMILPAEAVAVVGDFSPNAPLTKKLEIGFLNDTEFKGGDRKTVSIIVWRGYHENGVAGAQVMVKILGSSFRPMIFHAKTDVNGVAIVHLQLPHFRAGRAAILIRALVSGEETEMRRIITHG